VSVTLQATDGKQELTHFDGTSSLLYRTEYHQSAETEVILIMFGTEVATHAFNEVIPVGTSPITSCHIRNVNGVLSTFTAS